MLVALGDRLFDHCAPLTTGKSRHRRDPPWDIGYDGALLWSLDKLRCCGGLSMVHLLLKELFMIRLRGSGGMLL